MTAVKYYDLASSSWKRIASVQGPPGPQGPQGPKGDPGPTQLNYQRLFGTINNVAPITSATLQVFGLATINTAPFYELNYTPPVNAWWEVGFGVLLYKTDANYHVGYIHLVLTPADALDASNQTASWGESQHSTVQTQVSRYVRRTFALAAGVAYNVKAQFSSTGGTWNYHLFPSYTFLDARAWAR